VLKGDAGIDTVDYSTGGVAGRIEANLATGTVYKVLSGTSVAVGARGRYLRIYHSYFESTTLALALTGLKVFAGGVDVAAGNLSVVSPYADAGDLVNSTLHSPSLYDEFLLYLGRRYNSRNA
jgi:hypothetical protein